MWRYKIIQFKERHLVVICQTFAQSLRGSRGSSDLSFMSFGRSLRRYAAFPVWKKSAGSCYLITWVKFGISKFFYQLSVRRVHRWCVQSLVPICETAWEEFEKVGLWQFANIQNKTEAEMDGAYMTRLSTIQWTGGYVFLNVPLSIWEL